MKHLHALLCCVVLGTTLLCGRVAIADSVPDVLHYRFDGTGTSVPNLASNPPAGTETAQIMGGLTQSGPDLNYQGQGYSLVGTGVSSTSDYLNTGWAPDLNGSWTISFVTRDITPSAVLFYIFGDINTNEFRCFTNGVAGPNNWILRGAGIIDVVVPGGAVVAMRRTTFVYDQTTNVIHAYLDGTLVNSVNQGGPFVTGFGPFKVMGYSSNVGAPAGGLVDDFRIYRRALSAAEVQAIDSQSVLVVSGNGQPIVNGDTLPDVVDNTDFGAVAVGTGGLLQTYTITNAGTADLEIASIQLSGTHAADFSVIDAPTLPIPPATSAAFQVQFLPGATGLREAAVTIDSNSIVDAPFSVSIQGTGIASAIAVSGNGVPIANGDDTPDPADHTDVGTAVIDGGSIARSFVITNTGDADLVIDDVLLSGAAVADFSITQAPAATVLPGQNTSVEITFAPQTFGLRSVELTITSNAHADPVYTFDLQGIGEGADVQVSKTNLQNHLLPGVETVYTIQVTNAGPAAVSAVHVQDPLPASLIDAQWQCVSTPAGLCPSDSGGADIDETTGALPNGALLEYTLIATPSGNPSDFVTNTVIAENLDGTDPDASNNSATDTDPIVPFGLFSDSFETTGKQMLRPRIGP